MGAPGCLTARVSSHRESSATPCSHLCNLLVDVDDFLHADKMRFAARILALAGLGAANPTLPETPDTFKSSTTTNQASLSLMPACADGESPMNGNMCIMKQTGTFWYDLPGNRTRFDADPPDMSGGVMGSMMGGIQFMAAKHAY